MTIKMKKIAFILRIFQEKNFHGGGEKLFYNLIKRFFADGYIIDIYCSETDAQKVEYINKIIVINEHYDHNQPETMEKFYDKAKTIIKNENYTHVISENITPPIGITFLQGHSLINRLKKVKTPLEAFFYNFRKIKKQRIKYQEKWIKQGYRKIFTVSKLLKQDITENFEIPEDQISVIYPGVDIPETVNTEISKEIITFGLIAPGFKRKGGFVFLKALKILRKKGYKFKAKIIYPKFKKNLGIQFLVKIYNLSDCTEFLSFQKDMTGFYNSVDCLAAPSLEDTFNLTVLESMACKKPVIVSNSAGASEIIENKVNGFTFNVNKKGAENLAEKMMYFLDNPNQHEKLSTQAYNTAGEYSWDRTYKQLLKELEQL